MVFQDVYDLRWSMVGPDGRIRYLRSKTGMPIETALTPEAARIMERYRRGDSDWVFPFLHENGRTRRALSEESALRRVDLHAKRIGAEAGLTLPLTTYVMRHTWATLMQEAGKSTELIGQCLGHASIRTTQIYLSGISTARVDREVDDMVNRMLRPTPHRASPAGRHAVRRPSDSDRNRPRDTGRRPPRKRATNGRNRDGGGSLREKITEALIRGFPFLSKKEKDIKKRLGPTHLIWTQN